MAKRVHLSGSKFYDSDPTYFPRAKIKHPIGKAEQRYMATLSREDRERHLNARNHPSGRPSYGGANRSSNVKREIHRHVITVDRCVMCGGVTPDVLKLTTLFPVCRCGPLISSLSVT